MTGGIIIETPAIFYTANTNWAPPNVRMGIKANHSCFVINNNRRSLKMFSLVSNSLRDNFLYFTYWLH